jgi:HAD superfamily hydrolase (TIGR01509 family)
VFGLPHHICAGLFDLDVLLTQRATIHHTEWAGTLDDYLWVKAARAGEPYVPMGEIPAGEGVGALAITATAEDDAPAITATAEDDMSAATATAEDDALPVGVRKSQVASRRLAQPGVGPYPGSVDFVRAAGQSGLRRAAVSDSQDCREVLAAGGIDDAFEVVIDGLVVIEERLRTKPYPDLFLAAARRLGVEPRQCAVFSSSTAGMMAGLDGGFGFVVGVDRVGQAAALRANGAEVVVEDLSELLALG